MSSWPYTSGPVDPVGRMLRVGLTGGIGSGKSTACEIFSSLGIPIIDADQIARQLTGKGQPATLAIEQTFGGKVLVNGELDRGYLRKLAFNDDASRRKLEKILHPFVYNQIEKQVAGTTGAYCIICIPLLIETGAVDKVDRILVIDLPEVQQIQRAGKRDHADIAATEKIMHAQATREQRLCYAHDIIHNDGDIESLKQQILRLHESYKRIAPVNYKHN